MITVTIYEEDGKRRFLVHELDPEGDGLAIDVTDAFEVLDCPCADGKGDGFFIRQVTGEAGLLSRLKGD